MKLYIVDAFTEKPFGGNTAGVALIEPGAGFPDEEWMRRLAAELRYSETAFVRRDGASEFTVRYFTPAGEIDLCGHATIASFGVLYREGFVPEGTRCLNHTRVGDLEVVAGEQVMMQMATPKCVGTFEEPGALGKLLAAMGDGSMRDAVTLLDRTRSTAEHITAQTGTDAHGYFARQTAPLDFAAGILA